MRDHWLRFCRNYYARHDYEGVASDAAAALMADLGARLASLPGRRLGELVVQAVDDFEYHDPVDGSISRQQGIRILRGGAHTSS